MVAAAAALAGCGSGDGSVSGPVTVYVSVPLTGPRAVDGRDAADGARLALELAGGRAGDLDVRAEFLDDARGSRWDPVAVGENARMAAEDSSAAAYIGELDSQPTRASVPITNEAGIPQISPGAGAVDLTRPAAGYPDSPDRYHPSGERSFARVVPADDVVTRATAELAQRLGAERVAVALPGTAFGGLVAEQFSADAAEVGISVVADPARADLTVAEGDRGGLELRDGEDRVISPALAPSSLASAEFTSEFASEFDREPGPYAAYGYEAMELALQAIADADGADDDFRGEVVDALFGAERADSVLGSYSITDEGDSTLCAVQPYRRRGGALEPSEPICPGA